MEQRKKLELTLKGKAGRREENAKKDPGISEQSTEKKMKEEIKETF